VGQEKRAVLYQDKEDTEAETGDNEYRLPMPECVLSIHRLVIKPSFNGVEYSAGCDKHKYLERACHIPQSLFGHGL
jgi:hypothetical protein